MQVGPDEFALFGGLDLDGTVLEPALLLPLSARASIESAIGTTLVAANLVAQGAATLGGFVGLVRLTPETLKVLEAGAAPMSNGVANLGSLVDASGHIVRSVQWTSAGLAGAASGLVTLGPALAMMAMQMQLAKIHKLVAENLRLTDAVLEEPRTERWASVEGTHRAMLEMIEEARSIGLVNEHIWQNISGSEAVLQGSRAHFRSVVQGYLARLHRPTEPSAVREVLDHHGDAILHDVQGLLKSRAAWYTYQAIRAGHIHSTIDKDPTAAAHLRTVVAKAQGQHERDLHDAAELIDSLVRRASAMEAAKNSGMIPFGGKRKAAHDVARAGKALQKQLGMLHDSWGITDPPIPRPEIIAFDRGTAPEEPLAILRWHLKPEERLLAIGSVQDRSTSRGAWDWNLQDAWLYLAVTDERVIVAKKKDLTQKGEIAGSIPLGDIRYVRYRGDTATPDKLTARLDVVTEKKNLVLRFPDWSANLRNRRHVDAFAQLLQSVMALPHAVVPVSPIADFVPIEMVASDVSAAKTAASPSS